MAEIPMEKIFDEFDKHGEAAVERTMIVVLIGLWTNFRQTHDVNSFEITCCDDSLALFTALDALADTFPTLREMFKRDARLTVSREDLLNIRRRHEES